MSEQILKFCFSEVSCLIIIYFTASNSELFYRWLFGRRISNALLSVEMLNICFLDIFYIRSLELPNYRHFSNILTVCHKSKIGDWWNIEEYDGMSGLIYESD